MSDQGDPMTTATAEMFLRRAEAAEYALAQSVNREERLREALRGILKRASRLAEQERAGLTQQVLQEAFDVIAMAGGGDR